MKTQWKYTRFYTVLRKVNLRLGRKKKRKKLPVHEIKITIWFKLVLLSIWNIFHYYFVQILSFDFGNARDENNLGSNRKFYFIYYHFLNPKIQIRVPNPSLELILFIFSFCFRLSDMFMCPPKVCLHKYKVHWMVKRKRWLTQTTSPKRFESN